jgi:hypothetical protein
MNEYYYFSHKYIIQKNQLIKLSTYLLIYE